ncbi:lethal(2) giant larvae protein homolog 1-like isoform X2 [Gigantopelta aegis]|uniref:lethal(2) giant larvae protein homolog 1-like isoform X2 n=1 Tax=Gigantopelta aegis TaxID=1735272 RepID=UPI001B88AC0D|nr:lethal(2) giant larvae protein homolog 1-like isoform X2 [Gigantopelta aegis]
MFKFFKKHPPKEGEDRGKLKKELFGYKRCVDHGFPSKPSALAHDPKLNLLAFGTKSGVVKVVGAPGVQLSNQHIQDVSVVQLFFLSEQGRLISLCSDNTLHLWEINVRNGNSVLEEVKEFSMENNKTKTISTCCLSLTEEYLFLGTEGGNIHIMNVSTFKLEEQVIYQDVVMQNVPDDFKVNPGAVEAIAVHPTNPDKFLIGYNRGLVVLWDNKESNADQTYNATQQLECLSWNRSGESFMSAHADGSYIVWSSTDSTAPKEPSTTPYGPFPCKAINKLVWNTAKSDPYIIFSGGMPRASYGDRHTISVMQGENHVVFDFTSRIVDFVTITRAQETDQTEGRAEYDEPHTLIALMEEELVVVDLDTNNWPVIRLPYLNSIHSSAITCSQHISNVPDQLWQKISDAGESQNKDYSPREWPINGGKRLSKDPVSRDLLLTGHEDGSIRFWDASGVDLRLLYRLATCRLFGVPSQTEANSGEEDEWPPFRQVGTFDPYSDDPRLGIQKISLCPLSEVLVIAGTAGQVIIFQMEREEREQEVKAVTVNIVSDRDSFVWKGHEALPPRTGDIKFAAGYQATCMMQLYPPAACTAMTVHSEWQLVAAGTAHGFGLFDYVQKKEVATRCTLNATDLSGTSETPMSRRKSLKKSLRESFRRLRRRRSHIKQRDEKTKEKSETQHIEQRVGEGATAEAGGAAIESRPVERAVEARSADDSMASMVRCLYFADTFIVQGASHNPSLWAGTNGGHVYIYNLTVPSDNRSTQEVTCTLAKEIKLKHRAPVISLAITDGRARVLPDALEVQHERAKAPDMSGPHHVIIISEEQLKSFTLPSLKPRWKFKLTALDGSRIRKVAFVNFRTDNYSEFDIACLSNLGDLSVYAVTSLRQQMVVSAIRKDDINGISSFVFTKDGQGFYLHSPSEISRVSLSPRHIITPVCVLELKDGMRPQEPERIDEITEHNESTDVRYGTLDITQGLSDSQLNDSRADTTGDITVDSVIVTVTETPQTTVTTTNVTISVESPSTPETSPQSETPEVTAASKSNVDDDTKATTVCKTAEKPEVVNRPEDEVIDKLAELQMDVDPDDPAVLKQQLAQQQHQQTVVATVNGEA